jgi:hypothetical protein
MATDLVSLAILLFIIPLVVVAVVMGFAWGVKQTLFYLVEIGDLWRKLKRK